MSKKERNEMSDRLELQLQIGVFFMLPLGYQTP